MQSKAATVDEYIASLPEDRREAISAIRAVFRKNLDKGFVEAMGYGMPGYVVPHSIYPAGYHCDPKLPLPFAGFASQKNAISIYLMCLYSETDEADWFAKAWKKTGKKLDMGKCCIRAKKLEGFALDVIGEAIRRVPVKKYIEYYEASLKKNARASAGRSAARKAKKPKAAAQRAKPKTTKKVARRA